MTIVPDLKHRVPTYRTMLYCTQILITWCLAVSAVSAATVARWDEIRTTLFGDRVIRNGESMISLETPYRAMDAAVVPVTIQPKFKQTQENHIKDLYLIIDNNPSPLAAVFHFTGKHGWTSLSTRVRVNAYTDLRVLVENSDGNLFMVNNFVKASGGCSAPSVKDPAAAVAQLGKMKFRLSEEPTAGSLLPAQLLIKHPNNSGLQFDQISRNYIPGDFVRSIEVSYDGETLFTVDTDISISEDPNIRFGFIPENGGGELKARIKDSKGRTFSHSQSLSAKE